MKKKAIIIVFALLLGLGLAGTFWGTEIAEAANSVWGSCDKHKVNCEYPGDCHSYVDSNDDDICDKSQSNPASTTTTTTTKTTSTASTITSATTTTKTTSTASTVTSATTTSPVTTITTSITPTTTTTTTGSTEATIGTATKTATQTVTIPVTTTSTTTAEVTATVTVTTSDTADDIVIDDTDDSSSGSSYYFIPIFFGSITLYALTWILSKKNIIKTQVHRKIWNVVLGISTIVSAVLGIILILNLDYNTNIDLPFGMLFWHVEAGIVLGVVAALHIIWHWKYFVKIFKSAP